MLDQTTAPRDSDSSDPAGDSSDPASGLPDPALPEAEVTIRHRQTGGATVTLIAVTFRLTPFIQAIAAAYGTKLAGAIDNVTRAAVQRLLRRIHDRPEERHTTARRVVSVGLRSDSGPQILLDDALPAEAVAQLVTLAEELERRSGPQTGTVFWRPRGDAGGRWHLEVDGMVRAHWNRATNRWESHDA